MNKSNIKIDDRSSKFILNSCRELFFRWHGVSDLYNEHKRNIPRYRKDGTRHKIDKVEYQCSKCKKWFSRGELEVDHIEEVGRGEDTIEKLELLLDSNNIQLLCVGCHKNKTRQYSMERMSNKISQEIGELEL